MGASLGLIGPAISAGGALAGMMHPPASNVNVPPQFQMPFLGQSAGLAYQGIGDLSAFFGPMAGQIAQGAGQLASNVVNNPYAGGFQEGAGVASGLGQGAALGAYGLGSGLIGAGTGLFNPANAILAQGFDPQNALYGRTLQQLQDQTRVEQAARGINMTPYGAGLENQALSNFNIDWQNNLLNRMTQAGGAAGALYGQGANIAGQGAGLMAGAPGQYLTASSYPYSTYVGIQGAGLGALGQYGQLASGAQALQQAPIQDYLSYVQAGNQANQVANQNAYLQLAQQNAMYNQQQQAGSQFGQALTGIGKGWQPAMQKWGFA